MLLLLSTSQASASWSAPRLLATLLALDEARIAKRPSSTKEAFLYQKRLLFPKQSVVLK
jgi:hypothetical protein